MGKIRRPRTRPAPELVPEELIEDELELNAGTLQENVIPTVLEQLQGADIEEKYCGLQTFATLIEDQTRTQDVLSSGIIKVAAPLLMDGAASLRNSSAGVLNNLSRLGFEVCEAMMEQDIMTPLVAYFHEHAEKLPPKTTAAKKFDEESDTFTHCVSLLLNLCENSGLALKYFNTSNILLILVKYLDFETYGNDVAISVLQCLFVVSEDNVAVTETIKAECEAKLEKLLQIEGNDPSVHLLKTLASGIIINTCGGNITSLPLGVVNKIMSIFANTLSTDHRQACNELSSYLPVSDGGGKVKPLKGKEGQVAEGRIKAVSQLLSAQQTCVEIIANMFSCEENEDGIDTADSSDSEEMADDNTSLENGTNENSEQVPTFDRLPPEVSEAMASYGTLEKIWSKTMLPADNTLRILKEYEGSTSLCNVLSNLQSRSLLCINNMLSSLPLPHLGGVPGVYKMWVQAGKYAFRPNCADMTLTESATAVMRSALYRIKAESDGLAQGEHLFNELSLDDVETLLSGARECPVAEIRSNLIRMLGSLALLLTSSASEKVAEVVVVITAFIIDQAHKENEVWVVAECVDTLLDLYAEDETDALAARTGLVDKLQHLAPALKNKARQQRKSLGEHSVLVHTATSNLPRFIKYKRQRLALLP